MSTTKRKPIEYLGKDGSQGQKWSESIHNPMAASFVPLTDRSERAKARWWAIHAKKAGSRPTHGEFG